MLLKWSFAATVIAFTSWLAGKRPELAGFIVALPLTTLLALALSHAEYRDSAASITFAKSILLGIPVSILFFVPFLLSDKLGLGFWQCYAFGITLLAIGYFIHKAVLSYL